jgi:PAS domain S-box-containing protein
MNDSPQLAEWILEQTTDAVVCAGPDGSIIRWNQAANTLFGWSAGEVLGQSLEMIIPEHLRAAHWTGFDKAVATGTTRLGGRPSLTRAVTKGGNKLYVEMTFAVVKDDTGKVVASVAIARDVTERVQRERAASGH